MEERTKIDRHNEDINQIAGLADDSMRFGQLFNETAKNTDAENILGGGTHIYSGGKRNSKATKFSKVWQDSIANADRMQVFAEDSVSAT